MPVFLRVPGFQIKQKDDHEYSLTIYDYLGREVKNLMKNQGMPSGRHDVIWDGKNNSGEEVASGIYS